MVHNRKKLIDLFIGNISNAVLHDILEKSATKEMVRKYGKESLNSFRLAMKYREKINPKGSFPDKDAESVRARVAKNVRSELQLRITKGYEGIDFSLVDTEVERALRKTHVVH